ncbi:unnamed protein product [Oikopleura dioica]|uniref:Uncharacterized protein n=1 Tax=Oikopleura dioica TaxID=34765 RepID=E4XK53_OIKDI|nr:unnamed protein product [Oikopleura dioica]
MNPLGQLAAGPSRKKKEHDEGKKIGHRKKKKFHYQRVPKPRQKTTVQVKDELSKLRF